MHRVQVKEPIGQFKLYVNNGNNIWVQKISNNRVIVFTEEEENDNEMGTPKWEILSSSTFRNVLLADGYKPRNKSMTFSELKRNFGAYYGGNNTKVKGWDAWNFDIDNSELLRNYSGYL